MKKTVLIILTTLLTGFVFSQTKTEIKVSDLPKSVSDYVSKNMAGFSIDKAFKVVDKGVQSYAVSVKQGEIKHFLAFDKDGNFLKKADKEVSDAKQAAGEPAKSATVPVAKPAAPATTTPTTTQPKKK